MLFSAYGGYGHVLPMMGLGRALAREGHEVLFATSSELCPVVATAGLVPARAGLDDAAAVAEARNRWPETTWAPPPTWTSRMFCEIAAPAMAADLAHLLDEWRPDVIVREEGEHGAPLAAAAAGIPWVTHGWGSPLAGQDALTHLSRLLGPVWERAGLCAPEGAALYGAAVLDPCPPSLYRRPPPGRGRSVIRPNVEGDPGRTGNLQRGRHAYVGFGTVPLFSDVPALIRAVVVALLELDVGVTVTTGNEALAHDIRSLAPERVHVERWVDLPRVLRSCIVAVGHGGAGTVLSALAAGVPLLLVPQGAPSQVRMTTACEARGVGRSFVWTGENPIDLRRALSEVVSSELMHSAAAAVATEIAAMPPPSRAAAVLREVITGGP